MVVGFVLGLGLLALAPALRTTLSDGAEPSLAPRVISTSLDSDQYEPLGASLIAPRWIRPSLEELEVGSESSRRIRKSLDEAEDSVEAWSFPVPREIRTSLD